MVFRFSSTADARLPLSVRSVGRYHLNRTWAEHPKIKPFVQLFWTVSGQGSFQVGRRRVLCGPGDIFIYRPGDRHEIRTETDDLLYFWATLDHPKSTAWLAGFGLNARSHSAGPCPALIFEGIAAALRQATPEGERRSAHQMHALLLEASAPPPQQPAGRHSPAEGAKTLLERHFADPQFSIEALAEMQGMHRSTLFRLFSGQYGLTPSRYLQNLRLQRALELLPDERLQMQEVAIKAGYADASYFSRAIRATTGTTPWELRHGRRHHRPPPGP
jgi:AraC-like DNA-binding protein